MIPIKQTTFGKGKGNCFQAAMASVLELPLEEVPNFCCDYSADEWYLKVARWLRRFGLGITPIQCNHADNNYPAGVYLMSGPSDRLDERGKPLSHTVVARAGKMIHDPHPSNTGIKPASDVDLFYALDPAEIIRFQRTGAQNEKRE